MGFFSGIAGALGKVVGLIDDKWTTDEERAKTELEAAKLQTEVNLKEAQHASIFVAGWRPAMGWLSVSVIGYQMVVRDILQIYLPGYTYPALNSDMFWYLVMGMLGLGGARTFEKVKKVHRNSLRHE